MQPNGAKKNKLAHAIFSNEGPNLKSPEVTKSPSVTPKMYKLNNNAIRGTPTLKTDTPNKGIANNAAGMRPINDLKTAVIVSDVITSLNFIGAINKLVKFLLHISSRNIML